MTEPEADETRIAASLVARIAAGDAAAETEMLERYSCGLLLMLRRMTGRPDLADDLHQDTFQMVLERLRGKGLAKPERLAGFLNRTARNLFIADYRKKARRQTDDLELSSLQLQPGAFSRPPALQRAARARREAPVDWGQNGWHSGTEIDFGIAGQKNRTRK